MRYNPIFQPTRGDPVSRTRKQFKWGHLVFLCLLIGLFALLATPAALSLLVRVLPVHSETLQIIGRDKRQGSGLALARGAHSGGSWTYTLTVQGTGSEPREIIVPAKAYRRALTATGALHTTVLESSVLAGIPVAIRITPESLLPEGSLLESIIHRTDQDEPPAARAADPNRFDLRLPIIGALIVSLFGFAIVAWFLLKTWPMQDVSKPALATTLILSIALGVWWAAG